MVEARILLEGHAVRSIAGDRAAVDALVTALRANLGDQRGIDPAVEAFAKVDAEFHQLIAAADATGCCRASTRASGSGTVG